jgi:hypothetical protein
MREVGATMHSGSPRGLMKLPMYKKSYNSLWNRWFTASPCIPYISFSSKYHKPIASLFPFKQALHHASSSSYGANQPGLYECGVRDNRRLQPEHRHASGKLHSNQQDGITPNLSDPNRDGDMDIDTDINRGGQPTTAVF